MALEGSACRSDVVCAIGCCYGLLSPACLHVALQIAGRLHVTCIKKMTDESGSGVALSCGTVENMSLVVVDILYSIIGRGLKKT
jgi:hypothetical protein